jgi:hypothetical protein
MKKPCRFASVVLLAFSPSVVLDARSATSPRAPANVKHTASSPAHLRVDWLDNSSDEKGYRIWRRTAGESEWYLAGETTRDATHFDDGGMQHETRYEHKVAAFNAAGESRAVETSVATRTPRMTPHLIPKIVRPRGASFAAAPSALGLRNGNLMLIYYTGEVAHRRRQLNFSLWQVESADGGESWSTPRLLLEGNRERSFGKPALVRLPDGSIGLSFSRFGLDANHRINSRQRHFMRSTDEGLNWSPSVAVEMTMSANNDTLIVGDGGRLLQALSSYAPAAQIAASDDNGATWKVLAEVSARALPTGEAALAHVGAGRLVFLSRHEAAFYCLSYSPDNGHTWTPPGPLLYLGGGDNPPKLTRIPGSDVLVALVHSWYNGRQSKDRRQLGSVISRDGGHTWDNFRLIGHFPEGDDGFLQHSITFVGDTAYIFYGGGSNNDTQDGSDLCLLRVGKNFFVSTTPWPYDWRGRPLKVGPAK